MEDFYKDYKEKAKIISKACDCIEANKSEKLKEEIADIRKIINNLSIADCWQDSVGDKFDNVIKTFNEALTNVESSVGSDFKKSEELYLKLNKYLKSLEEKNKEYSDKYEDEPSKSSYVKTRTVINSEGNYEKQTYTDTKSYNNDHSDWEDAVTKLEEKCKKLVDKIDRALTKLTHINEIDLSDANIIDVKTLSNVVTNLANAFGTVGKFIPSNNDNSYGYIFSSLDGLMHTVFRQDKVGWPNDCNRAAASSIASAFCNEPMDAVKIAKKFPDGIGYDQEVTDNYFSQFGLKANVFQFPNKRGAYNDAKNDLVTALQKGKYVMFDLADPNVTGKSGQKWTSTRHWLAALDIRKGANGYEVFISDSGHGGSSTDHGLGEGWYNVDEFDNQVIARLTTISKKEDVGNVNIDATTADLKESLPPKTVNIPNHSISSNQTVSGTDTEATIYNVLKKHGYNDAAISGIMGNMEHESAFNTNALGDNGHSHGICQWNETKNAGYRWTKATKWMESNGYDVNSAEGQAEYMVHELENSFSKLNDTIKNIDNTDDGARTVAREFSLRYEMPAAKEKAANARASSTTKYYNNYVGSFNESDMNKI